MKRADPEEVRNIKDQVIKYLNESARGSTSWTRTTCFVCGRQSRGYNHNVKDCIQIVDVSLQANGQMRYAQASGRPLNTCVRGSHAHEMYAEQLACATNGEGRFATVEKFRELEGQGATPCPQCGDVFPSHQPEHCPNYPYLAVGDQGFKAAYDAQALAILEQLQVVAGKITGEETAGAACPSCTESDEHHNWRSCLKRMKCRKGPEGNWEMEPPGDPKDIPEGYQVSPCENCCTAVPNHSTDNCPHPECCNYGVWFAIARGEPYIVVLWGYLNGITEIDELCPICNWFVMRNIGVLRHNNPKECLKNCWITLKEGGDQLEIKFDAGKEPSPMNLCVGGQHAHESWQEYRQCYAQLQEKYTLCQEIHALRGDKTHEFCRVCADIFADHADAQCPVEPGSENPSLLSFWDSPTGSFVRFIGMMVEHANGTQMGPCPLCSIQEDQHN